jgi:two-component system KDP operon response regulator KdpE
LRFIKPERFRSTTTGIGDDHGFVKESLSPMTQRNISQSGAPQPGIPPSNDETIDKPVARILIVDDDYALRRALHTTLFSAGFDVAEAASGEDAVALARVVKYDVVLLDLRMPGKSGIETCRELRRRLPRLAILMLSVSDAEDEMVEALESGADDYVTKPFQMRELIARVRAAARRVKAPQVESDTTIRIGELELHPARRLVYKSKTPVHLTPKEFDLLHYLMAHTGIPITHSRLLGAVWGPEYVNQVEYLRTFIRQLRKKLEDDAASPKHILTDSYVGYRFLGDETSE